VETEESEEYQGFVSDEGRLVVHSTKSVHRRKREEEAEKDRVENRGFDKQGAREGTRGRRG